MKKYYKVVFAMSYVVKAQDEKEAEEQAWELFGCDVHASNLDVFGCDSEEITELELKKMGYAKEDFEE